MSAFFLMSVSGFGAKSSIRLQQHQKAAALHYPRLDETAAHCSSYDAGGFSVFRCGHLRTEWTVCSFWTQDLEVCGNMSRGRMSVPRSCCRGNHAPSPLVLSPPGHWLAIRSACCFERERRTVFRGSAGGSLFFVGRVENRVSGASAMLKSPRRPASTRAAVSPDGIQTLQRSVPTPPSPPPPYLNCS